jgi:hypothetical protein
LLTGNKQVMRESLTQTFAKANLNAEVLILLSYTACSIYVHYHE